MWDTHGTKLSQNLSHGLFHWINQLKCPEVHGTRLAQNLSHGSLPHVILLSDNLELITNSITTSKTLSSYVKVLGTYRLSVTLSSTTVPLLFRGGEGGREREKETTKNKWKLFKAHPEFAWNPSWIRHCSIVLGIHCTIAPLIDPLIESSIKHISSATPIGQRGTTLCHRYHIICLAERWGKAIKWFLTIRVDTERDIRSLGLIVQGCGQMALGEFLARPCCRRHRRDLESWKMTLRVPQKFSVVFFLESGSSNPKAMDRSVSSSKYRKIDFQYLWYKLLLWIEATLCKCTCIWILSLLCSAGYKQKCWAPRRLPLPTSPPTAMFCKAQVRLDTLLIESHPHGIHDESAIHTDESAIHINAVYRPNALAERSNYLSAKRCLERGYNILSTWLLSLWILECYMEWCYIATQEALLWKWHFVAFHLTSTLLKPLGCWCCDAMFLKVADTSTYLPYLPYLPFISTNPASKVTEQSHEIWN